MLVSKRCFRERRPEPDAPHHASNCTQARGCADSSLRPKGSQTFPGDRECNRQETVRQTPFVASRTGAFPTARWTQPKKRPPNPSDFPVEAGKWIDQHLPAHDRELYANGFAHGVSRFYTLGSAIIHGYKWPMDYVQKSERVTFGMVADGLAAAVGMAECAVALYEVQAQRRQPPTQRERLYPLRLQPTIDDWSTLYE
jgi:hypothetical protein